MTSGRWVLIKTLFDQALDTPEGERRQSLLAGAPPEIADQALRLIQLHERAKSFLSESPPGVAGLRTQGEQLAPGMILNGRFEVRRLVGFGGMGQVYEALDRELSQAVAVKFVNFGANNARFMSEIQIARRVTHPNVCRIFDVERHEDLVFCTMEFLNGETLSARLERGPLQLAELIATTQQICAGLSAAHDAGIIHRDLKSANIIIEHSSRVVITDFGLAQPIDQPAGACRHTGRNEIMGTLAYMAPEVLAGRSATVRSDIYSLGVLLYESATGQLPFESSGPLASIVRRAIEPALPPSSLNRGMSRHIDGVILACLQPDPSKRPGSPNEVAERVGGSAPIERRKILIWGAISASALSLFAAGYRYTRQGPATSGIKAVLLAPLQNTTADKRFAGMALLLRNQLMQSSHLDVLSEARVHEILSRMESPPDRVLDVLAAREVALRNGATLIVYANISRLGPDLLLDLKIEQPASRPDFARQSWDRRFSATGDQDLLSRARDAAIWVRQIAGESPKEIDFRNRSAQEITTFSWDALALFNAAREKRVELPEQAEMLLKEALRIDSQFPSANRDLADLLVSQRKYREGYDAWQRAIEASRRRQLNSRERYRLEAFYADDVGDLAGAESVNRAWIANYPSDYLPHFLLGNVYLRQNRVAEGTRHMEEASLLRPQDVAVEANLVFHYAARGEFDKARSKIEELRRFAPAEVANEVDAKARFVWGRPIESLKILDRALSSNQSGVRHRAAMLTAAILAELGRYQEASEKLSGILPEDEARGDWQWRALKLVSLAGLAYTASRVADAVEYARLAMTIDDGDFVQEQAGVLLARCGSLKAASQALGALRRLPPLPRTVRRVNRLAGEIALQRKEWSNALALLRAAARDTANWDLNDSLARVLEMTGALDEALIERRRLAQLKGFMWLVAERALPGTWSANVSALVALATRMGRAADADFWSKQLEILRR